jgi:hypothetical protein
MKHAIRTLLICATLLTACQDSDDDPGKVQIAITDAAGDFYSYAVDVTSVALKRADGAVVETLPTRTRVDFAEYVELAELFTVRRVPIGTYAGVRLTLDYADAQILAENDAGEAVAVVAVDEAGATLTSLTVDVDFGPNDRFTVRPGVPAHVTLDFDLAASHRLDSTANPAEVTVSPVMFADARLNDDRPYRLRGLVESVDEAGSSLVLDLRPFDRRDGDYGEVTVQLTDATQYLVDGRHFTGGAGASALAELDLPAPAMVVARVDRATRSVTALQVFAGGGERGASDDVVRGHVVARSGDSLTVLGLLADRDEDRAFFSRSITVDMDDATTVSKEGAGLVATADVSVGQRVDIVGDHDTGIGDAAHLVARHVRLRYTDLAGTVVQASPLVLDLQAFDRVPVNRFDFTGTGSDPGHYGADTGSLGLAGIGAGEPVRVRGFVAPFGSAPPDFAAVTVINATQMPARLGVSWQLPGSRAAFAALDATQILVDLDDPALGLLHHVRRAGVVTDLTTLGADLTVAPAALGRYAVVAPGSITVYASFTEFTAAIAQHMGLGSGALILGAGGRFDDAGVTFTAGGAAVVLLPGPP